MSTERENQADAERVDLVEEWGHSLVEVLASDEVLKHVPVVKTFVAAFKTYGTVRDAILLKKIQSVLDSLSGLAPAERAKMVRRLEADPAYKRKVGMHLIELLDRVDSYRKPLMIGYVFEACLSGRIEVMQLHRLNAAIERLPSHDIDVVREVVRVLADNRLDLAQINDESKQAMINAGLAFIESGYGGGGFKVTATCSLFVQLDLDVKSLTDAQ